MKIKLAILEEDKGYLMTLIGNEIVMLKVSSTSFAQNLSSAVGVIVTTFAIGLFVAAYIWGQKIIDIR